MDSTSKELNKKEIEEKKDHEPINKTITSNIENKNIDSSISCNTTIVSPGNSNIIYY